jgi:hypothetical protein
LGSIQKHLLAYQFLIIRPTSKSLLEKAKEIAPDKIGKCLIPIKLISYKSTLI